MFSWVADDLSELEPEGKERAEHEQRTNNVDVGVEREKSNCRPLSPSHNHALVVGSPHLRDLGGTMPMQWASQFQ